jgi:hypothetical protein
MSLHPIVLLAVGLALLPGQVARSRPPVPQSEKAPPAKRAVRTDRYGDPLPPGVVARLGTDRLVLDNAAFLTFSPDGRRLASHNGNTDLRVWEVATGKEVLRLKTPRFQYGAQPGMDPLVFSPDGKVLALGCSDKTVRVWDVATGKELHAFRGLRGHMGHLAFTPDGRSLVAGGPGPVPWTSGHFARSLL